VRARLCTRCCEYLVKMLVVPELSVRCTTVIAILIAEVRVSTKSLPALSHSLVGTQWLHVRASGRVRKLPA